MILRCQHCQQMRRERGRFREDSVIKIRVRFDLDNEVYMEFNMARSSLEPQSSAPSSPSNGELAVADGDDWQPGSTDQGTDNWLVRYRSSDTTWVGIYNITDGTNLLDIDSADISVDDSAFSGNLDGSGDYDDLQEISDALDALSASGFTYTEQADDPTYDEMDTGDIIVATTSGDMFLEDFDRAFYFSRFLYC